MWTAIIICCVSVSLTIIAIAGLRFAHALPASLNPPSPIWSPGDVDRLVNQARALEDAAHKYRLRGLGHTADEHFAAAQQLRLQAGHASSQLEAQPSHQSDEFATRYWIRARIDYEERARRHQELGEHDAAAQCLAAARYALQAERNGITVQGKQPRDRRADRSPSGLRNGRLGHNDDAN
jgi:hypothetical protein